MADEEYKEDEVEIEDGETSEVSEPDENESEEIDAKLAKAKAELEGGTPPADQRPPRRERRRERRNLMEEHQRAQMENQVLQQARERDQQVIQQLLQQRQPEPPPQQQPDTDAQLGEVYQQIQQVYDLYAAKKARGELTDEVATQLSKQLQSLDAKKTRLIVGGGQQQQPVDTNQLANQVLRQAIMQDSQAMFPDVWSNQAAVQFANAKYHEMVSLGQPRGRVTHIRSMEEARRQFYGPQPSGEPPSQSRKTRYTGVPRGARQAGNEPRRVKIRMDGRSKALAEAMFPSLPKEQAHKKWAQKVGPRVLAAEKQGDRG